MYPWTKPMIDSWFKSFSDMGSVSGNLAGTPFKWPEQDAKAGMEGAWQMPLQFAQSMCDSFASMWGGKQNPDNQTSAVSNLIMSMMQMGLEGYVDLQEKWLKGIQQASGSPGAGQSDDFMKSPSKWGEIFQELFGPLLNMPAIGLTREYQEQLKQVVEKYNVFSASIGELLYQLNIPMEEATRILREQEGEGKKEGKASGKKSPYDRWVSILEGRYMELFKSPEYLDQLRKAIDSYSDFAASQQQLYGSLLRNLPVATTKDLDELSKEIYHLKKKYKALVKLLENQQYPMDQGSGNISNGN